MWRIRQKKMGSILIRKELAGRGSRKYLKLNQLMPKVVKTFDLASSAIHEVQRRKTADTSFVNCGLIFSDCALKGVKTLQSGRGLFALCIV
jgi:hypothetical protein